MSNTPEVEVKKHNGILYKVENGSLLGSVLGYSWSPSSLPVNVYDELMTPIPKGGGMNNELKQFAKWTLEQTFDGCDINGDDAQRKAHDLALMEMVKFDPDIHCNMQNSEICDPGDDFYLYTDLLN